MQRKLSRDHSSAHQSLPPLPNTSQDSVMSASASPAVGDRLKKPGSTYLPPRPGRRRDKPQLSCSSCKQRKYVGRLSPCAFLADASSD